VDAPDAEREQAVARLGENLGLILRTLQEAPEPAPRITVLALYDPLPENPSGAWVGRANGEIRRVAQQHGARVAAGDRAFRGREDEYLRPGDVHPNDAGYEALARAFARADGLPG
jgi:lysophospholipase L1-like esterase